MPQRYHWIRGASIVLYLISSAILIRLNPGFQYDEALQVLGAAHLLHSRGPLPLPQDPDTWIYAFDRWLPLMTVRYVGAVKEYLCWPLFALWGPGAEIVRWVSALMGALGIWGVSSLVSRAGSPAAGAVVAFVLAVHPGYVHNVIFDNGSIAGWMAAFGLMCLAISRYLLAATALRAFWIGCAMGLGIWARANYVWLLAALLVGAAVALKRRFRVPWPHVLACFAGGVAGGSVLLIYQIVSGGGTFAALGMFQDASPWSDLLTKRWTMFSEVLMLDRERRAIWGGGPAPLWQLILIPALVLLACALCLVSRDVLKRTAAIAFLVLTAILFTSRMLVAEHHMAVVIPLAASIGVLACKPQRAYAGYTLLGAYLACALYWHGAAIHGLARTGGEGPWSDAIYTLNQEIRRHNTTQRILVLDWGLQNNLFVLTGGQLRSREIFAQVPKDPEGSRRFWRSQFESGGVYLLNGLSNRQFPETSTGFLQALSEFRPTWKKIPVSSRSGATFAELIEVRPHAVDEAASSKTVPSYILTKDPSVAGQLEGFHQVEQGWRWTKRTFAVTLPGPDAKRSARLVMDGFIPDPVLRQGPVTLSPRIGDHTLPPETFSKAGRFLLVRDIEPGWLEAAGNRISFTLDKALGPSPSDGRELGVIVSAVSLEPR
jgi:hypothetical protein